MRPGLDPSADVTFRTRINPGAINGAPTKTQCRASLFRTHFAVGGALMRPVSNPSADVTFRTRIIPGAINGAPTATEENVGGALMRPGKKSSLTPCSH